MAEHLIDLVSKPMCLIKLVDFSFKILNDPIPDPNPKPNPYKNRIKVKKDKKKSLTKFKNKKKPGMGFKPLPNLLEALRQDDCANNELAGDRRNNLYL